MSLYKLPATSWSVFTVSLSSFRPSSLTVAMLMIKSIVLINANNCLKRPGNKIQNMLFIAQESKLLDSDQIKVLFSAF